MKKNNVLYVAMFFLSILGLQSSCFGQDNSFDQELSRLKTNTAQVFGNEISQMPIWSLNSDILYCKKQSDKIFSINLNTAKLTVGVWHKDTIGVISVNLITPLTLKERERFMTTYKTDENEPSLDSIKTKTKIVVKFANGGLVLQEKDTEEKVLWTSSSVCGGIVLSPNEKYVAFYCETSGVFIMKIQ